MSKKNSLAQKRKQHEWDRQRGCALLRHVHTRHACSFAHAHAATPRVHAQASRRRRPRS